MIDSFKFWGAATVGSKGQVVIPAEARANLGIHEGDKLLVVTPPQGTGLIIVKPDVLEGYMKQMQVNLQTMLQSDETPKEDAR